MTAVEHPGFTQVDCILLTAIRFRGRIVSGNASLLMYFHSFGSFRATLAGTGPLAALAANAPYVADFPKRGLQCHSLP